MSKLKKERSVIIALIAVIIATIFKQSIFYDNSVLFDIILFICVLFVIIYAAFAVVHHAEVLAHKFGEPYGTMILTFSAVTVEIIMITTMMLHGDNDPLLARDTVFSTLMILINGLVGLTMIMGGMKFGEQHFNLKGSSSFLSTIFVIAGIGLFIPGVIAPDLLPKYEIFLIVICLLLYGIFVRLQSKEHSYFFTYTEKGEKIIQKNEPELEKASGLYHGTMLVITIALISILAEYLSITLDNSIEVLGLPEGLAALVISLIIVSPESLTAIRAGMANNMQRAINISLGSALSTIMLTIPAVLLVGIIAHREVIWALTPVQLVMVILSLAIGLLSTNRGETNALQGFIHFILFLTFVFMIFL